MEDENSKSDQQKKINWNTLALLLSAIASFIIALYLILGNLVATGSNLRGLQPTAKGGEYFIFIGLFFLIATYYSLSPFSRLRQFIEGKTRTRKKKSKNWKA